MNLELAVLSRLAGEPLGAICLCPLPAGTGVPDVGAATPVFSISSESRFSFLYRKKCYPFSHLPSSSSDILGSSFLHCPSPDTFITVSCVSFLISFIAHILQLQFELHKEEFLCLSIYLIILCIFVNKHSHRDQRISSEVASQVLTAFSL